ncbi:MAG: hypothetical protein F4Z75_01140 [Synechococcus sp. SB0668_bin_15]|nr:hypothetical protein [Synechococcus sp. SB0668_bin_15]MYC48895.1 hypothetical protein [Synechococcus sp. SB0662_bin_14]
MPAAVQTLLMIVTALGIWAGVGVTILIFLWNKLDKRFDDQNKRFDAQDRRFDAQDKRIDALHDEVKGLPLKIMEMLRKAPR